MRKQLSKSEIKEINNTLNELYNLEEFFSKKDKLEICEEGEYKFIKKNNKICFFYYENRIVPTLKTTIEKNFLKKITVDMGAVKYVISGADVMRPGIVKIDDNIKENEVIVIVDETHSKPLAIGIALSSSEGIREQKQGKSIKNLHYAGDKLWENT